MKTIKKIVAAIVSLAMICSVSTAVLAAAVTDEANFYTFTANILDEAKAGETIRVALELSSKDGSSITLNADMGGAFCRMTSGLHFDTSLLTLASATATMYEGMTEDAKLTSGNAMSEFVWGSTLDIPSGSAIATYTFTVKESVEPGTYTNAFRFDESQCGFADDTFVSVATMNTVVDSLVVVGDEPESSVQATKGDDGIITVTGDSALAGKDILVHDAALPQGANLSAASRFVVRQKSTGITHDYNIFEALNVEGLYSSISSKNIKFGIVSNSDLVATDFEFSFTGIN